jgi:hypothetical protein
MLILSELEEGENAFLTLTHEQAHALRKLLDPYAVNLDHETTSAPIEEGTR